MRLVKVPCADIRPDPRSRGYGPDEIEPLAQSVREHGVLRPLLLRVTPLGYVIVHGERRWRAAQMAGLPAIPAWLVQEYEPSEAVAA